MTTNKKLQNIMSRSERFLGNEVGLSLNEQNRACELEQRRDYLDYRLATYTQNILTANEFTGKPHKFLPRIAEACIRKFEELAPNDRYERAGLLEAFRIGKPAQLPPAQR